MAVDRHFEVEFLDPGAGALLSSRESITLERHLGLLPARPDRAGGRRMDLIRALRYPQFGDRCWPVALGGRQAYRLTKLHRQHRDRAAIDPFHRKGDTLSFEARTQHVQQWQVMVRCWYG